MVPMTEFFDIPYAFLNFPRGMFLVEVTSSHKNDEKFGFSNVRSGSTFLVTLKEETCIGGSCDVRRTVDGEPFLDARNAVREASL